MLQARFAALILLSLALPACAPQATATPTALPTATPVPPSATPAFVPAATATIVPTATPVPPTATPSPTPTPTPHPLSIEAGRKTAYPGSPIKIEQNLPAGVNYSRYVASYQSDGFKIYALLTIPNGKKPATGWPIVVFNHGYIPPTQYRTTEKYVGYQDAFARLPSVFGT